MSHYCATLSDDEFEDESDFDYIRNFIAFTAHTLDDVFGDYTIVASSSNPVDTHIPTDDDDELPKEVLADTCKMIYYNWIEESKVLENQDGERLNLSW